jgi:hypothetical protein
MSPQILRPAFVVGMSLVLLGSCASEKKENKTAPTSLMSESTNIKVEPASEKVDFTTVEFNAGDSKLGEMDRRHLKELAAKMASTGKIIDDIKILTWSDRLVATSQEATSTEIILARQRAESIKNFLEKNLSETEDIDFYNMAENPERHSNYMKRKGVPIDQAFNEDGILGSPNGRAIVIIEYQGNPIPATL